jgi:hypothetical protein
MMPDSCQRGTEPAQICVTSERKPASRRWNASSSSPKKTNSGLPPWFDEGLVEVGVFEAGIVEDEQVLREGGKGEDSGDRRAEDEVTGHGDWYPCW